MDGAPGTIIRPLASPLRGRCRKLQRSTYFQYVVELNLLVFRRTFEPAPQHLQPKTPPVNGRRFWLYGAPGTIRTCDRLVRSQVLYPAELRAQKAIIAITPW